MNLPLERAHYLSKNEILTTVFQFNHIALDEVAGKGKWELKKLELNDLKKVLNQIQEVIKKMECRHYFVKSRPTASPW